ncbi:MAG: MFS transporter [Rectinemataceae bacterium]
MRYTNLPFYVSLTAFAISANAVPPLISTLAEELHFQAWALGTGIIIQFLSFAAISWLGGALVERLGIAPRMVVLAGLILLSLSLLFAPLVIGALIAIFLWMAFLGFAGGMVETFASLSLTQGSNEGSCKPICISQVVYAIGALVAPVVVGASIARGGGWKPVFMILGALATLVTLGYVLFDRGPQLPSAVPAPPIDNLDHDRNGPSGSAQASSGAAWVFRAIILVYVIGEALCMSWMPYMLETLRGLKPETVAFAFGLFWIGMIAGRAAVVFLPDRLTLRPTLVVSSILAALAAIVLLAAPHIYLPALMLLGMAMGPVWPVTVKMAAAELQRPSLISSVIAIGGLGAALGPLIGSLLLAKGFAGYYFGILSSIFFCVAVIIAASPVLKGRTAK